MKKLCDMPENGIPIGLKVRSLVSDNYGYVSTVEDSTDHCMEHFQCNCRKLITIKWFEPYTKSVFVLCDHHKVILENW